MCKIEKVIEILKKRSDNGRKEFTVEMHCNGEKVTISPCKYDDGDADPEYFLVYCSLPWSGFDTWEKLAQFLMDYEKHVNEAKDEKSEITNYFLKYFSGCDEDKLRVGSNVAYMAYDYYHELPKEAKTGVSYIFDEKLVPLYIEKYREAHPMYSTEYLTEALELSERWSSYSDWHKDVFGFRPHGMVCGEYINPHF